MMGARQAFLAAAVVVAATVAPAGWSGAAAQPDVRFDVASIRRNTSGDTGGSGLAAPQPGGRYVGIGVTLRRLVEDAYEERVIGGPEWADADRFDVNARADGDPSPAQIRRMLRPLLAERFKLAVRAETREMPVYLLTLARAELRPDDTMRPSGAACAAEARTFFPAASNGPPPCGDFRLGAGSLGARAMTMAGLARVLSGQTGRPVLDRTGRGDAAFDLELEWSSGVGLAPPPPDAAGAGDLRPDGLSLFTALQEQLGLRLDPARGPVPVIVIDSAEPPAD